MSTNRAANNVADMLSTCLACSVRKGDNRLNAFLEPEDIGETIRLAIEYLRHDPQIQNASLALCAGCAQTATESGQIPEMTPTCPGCVGAMASHIAELEAEKNAT